MGESLESESNHVNEQHEKHAYYFNHNKTQAVIRGDWKLVRERNGPWHLYSLSDSSEARVDLHSRWLAPVTSKQRTLQMPFLAGQHQGAVVRPGHRSGRARQ